MGWFKGLFLDRRRFWAFASVLLMVVSLRKGFRKPIPWAATQAQVDYSHGFIKRGLFGALVSKPLHLEHYQRFAAVSLVLLLVLMVLLAVFAWRSGMVARSGSAMPLAVFGASYAVMFLGSITGYMDIPLGILTVLLLMVKSLGKRTLLAVPVVIAALLIHEIFCWFLPVIVLSFVVQGLFANTLKERGWAFAAGLGVLLLAVGVTVVEAGRAPATPQRAAAMHDAIVKRVDFTLDPMFFEVFTRSAMDNVKIMRVRSHETFWRAAQVGSTIVLLPTAGLLLAIAYRLLMLQAAGTRRRRVWLALVGCVVATLMPISMNIFGWDVGRWYALAGVAAFLTLGTVCLHVPGPALDEQDGFERAAVLAIALGIVASGFLIEGTARLYPFIGT